MGTLSHMNPPVACGAYMNETEFRQLVSESTEILRTRIAEAREHFDIGAFERYDYDLNSNLFWWSDAGVPKIEARIVIAGSVSTNSTTWLWSWANPHFDELRSPEIEFVRAYGVRHGIHQLTEPKWPADEIDGWEMTSIAARLLESMRGI